MPRCDVAMSLSDAAARFKKLSAEQEQQPKQAERMQIDPEELYTLRSRALGVLIRDARISSGYAVEDIAEHLNLPADVIIEWEFGRHSPSLPQLELLAYFLEIPISHFWSNETLMAQQSRRHSINGQEFVTLRNHMIGALIRSRREAMDMAIEALAEKLGIGVDMLNSYELGHDPVPTPTLLNMTSLLEVNLDYFLDANSRVGAYFERQQLAKSIDELPPEIREFVSVPANAAYIRLAISLSQMPTDALRMFAESLLDITY